MPALEYVYVDGESHFIRSQDAWRKLHGPDARLEQLRYVGQPDDRLVFVNPKAKIFWTRKMNPGAERTTYFTSFVGDDAALHEVMVELRAFELEDAIVSESRQQSEQRKNALQQQCLIEKPKGVDIALAVRVLEDAYRNLFQVCHVYTSDADFVPLIRAVRAQGKRVHVHGYNTGLSLQSELLHAPDSFVDLTVMLRNECELIKPQ